MTFAVDVITVNKEAVAGVLVWLGRGSDGKLLVRTEMMWPVKGTNPALKKPSNIPEIYAKIFGRFH